MDNATLASDVNRYRWYHTLDLGHGVVTPGIFDHRQVVDRYLLPSDLSGLRCLDVGTMDGFWAFEMERRGAEQVVAVDIDDPETLDWPHSLRHTTSREIDATKELRFNLAKEALGSSVSRVLRSVYDLDTDLGLFDLVVCGDLLLHLKDPLTALERLLRVCRGSAVVCTPIVRVRFGGKKPLAIFDGIDNFQWWLPSNSALERMLRAAGFSSVTVGKPFFLPSTSGGPWKGLRGVMRAFV
jgi:tRNA (mo5U34)-methyltransferase